MTRRMGIVLGVLVILSVLGASQASGAENQPYKAEKYGFALILPEGVGVFTPERPGPFTFEKGSIVILANRRSPGDFILVNESSVATDKDLQDWRSSLESRGLPQAGYRKISLQAVAIGRHQDKQAVEHVFDMQGKGARILKQICLIHRGRGLCFTCNTTAERYQQTNQEFFDPILRSLTFE